MNINVHGYIYSIELSILMILGLRLLVDYKNKVEYISITIVPMLHQSSQKTMVVGASVGL